MNPFNMGDVGGIALLPAAIGAYAPVLVLMIYFFAQWDARREGSSGAADTQIGLKVAVHVFVLLGILVAAGGVHNILSFILGKMKGGAPSSMIKMGIGNLLAGGGVFAACWLLLLPRTNWQEHDKITRLTYGTLAALSGIMAILALSGFLSGIIGGAPWGRNAPMLASIIVFGGLGFLSLTRLGATSGWVAPPPKAPAFPAPGGGYDPNQAYGQQPPQQGYPPQGGYPPAGGAPPAGGYPPAGGAPPAGGGYPPPQGGGLPPPSGGGGGYPPAGGNY